MATTRTASARANARAHPRARARMATILTRRILSPWCWSWVRARRRVRFGITSRYASSRARRARPSTRISSSISSRTTTGRSRRTPRTRSDGAGSDGTPTDAAASDRFGGVNISPAWISSRRRAGLAEAVHEGVATHQRQARVRHVLAAIRARITSRAKLKCESRLFRECILEPNPGERECILSRTRTRTNPKPGKSNPHRTPHPTTPSQEPARRARAARRGRARRRASSRDATQVRAHIVARDDERSRRRRRTRVDACDGSRNRNGTRIRHGDPNRLRHRASFPCDVSRVESSRGWRRGRRRHRRRRRRPRRVSEKTADVRARARTGRGAASAAPVRRGR